MPPWLCVIRLISIHALREEGDVTCRSVWSLISYFYPRPPRGGRPKTMLVRWHRLRFLSTPSARRATENDAGPWAQTQISIHALREEGDTIILI